MTAETVKKARELRFTYEDLDGRLRAVVLQVQHVQDGEDRVRLQVISDRDPVDVQVLVAPKVKRGRARST